MEVHPIGRVECEDGGFRIALDPEYAPALRGLEGYSHVMVVWWFDRTEGQKTHVEEKPYVKGPDELGVFATRSPLRPNPIAVSSAAVAYVDKASATVGLHYMDALPQSPVLDLKPYVPGVDRVVSTEVEY